MDTIFNKAITFHKEGKLEEATKLYQEILKTEPKNSASNHNLGLIFFSMNNINSAIPLFKAATEINSNVEQYWISYSKALIKDNLLNEAEVSCKRAINLKPNSAEAYFNLGIIMQKFNRLDEAEASYKKAIQFKPDYIEAYINLGITLDELSRFDEAELYFKKAIELKPDYILAYNNLGATLHKLAKFDEAEEIYKKAIELKPNYAEAYFNLGNLMKDFHKLDKAEDNFKKAIEHKSNYVEAYNNLGTIYNDLNRLEDAEISYKKAIIFNPQYAKSYNNLGAIQFSLKRFEESLLSYNRASELKPDMDYLMGTLLHTKMHLCLWDNLEKNLQELTKKINEGKKVSLPFPILSLIDDPDIQWKMAKINTNHKFPKSNIFPKISHYHSHKKIKIAYFSSDFRDHPVARLNADIYEIHNRKKFEIHAFSFGLNTNDEFNIRIKKSVDHFHDIRMTSDIDVVKLARFHEIDIAIDLVGFTAGGRQSIFAMLAAPIQVSYLGYPGTMSADYIDYLIADYTLIPLDKQNYYSEKIIYMPNSYQPNSSKRDNLKITLLRDEFELPKNSFVFCCFNNNYKITPTTFVSWMKILKATRDSVLWLLVDNIKAIKNLKREATKLGVNEDRLIFAKHVSNKEHLKRIQLADLFIDTFPYNAHTTASDALKMGLPVLTCTGNSFASRVVASLLNAIKLPELITTTQNEYETLAIELATHPKKIKIIKDKLINNFKITPLYDTHLYVKHLETAYSTIHERSENGLNVENIKISN